MSHKSTKQTAVRSLCGAGVLAAGAFVAAANGVDASACCVGDFERSANSFCGCSVEGAPAETGVVNLVASNRMRIASTDNVPNGVTWFGRAHRLGGGECLSPETEGSTITHTCPWNIYNYRVEGRTNF